MEKQIYLTAIEKRDGYYKIKYSNNFFDFVKDENAVDEILKKYKLKGDFNNDIQFNELHERSESTKSIESIESIEFTETKITETTDSVDWT